MSEDFMCITSIRNCLCCDKEMKGDDDFCVDCEKDDLERQLAEYKRFKRCVELNLYAPPLDIKPQTESDYKQCFINIVRGLNQLKEKGDE